VKKSDREIMEILEAFDATGCAHSAAVLAGWTPRRCGATSPSERQVRRSTGRCSGPSCSTRSCRRLRSGTWRLAGCRDYWSKYEHPFHVSPTGNQHDAIDAIELALADYEAMFGHPMVDDCPVDVETGEILPVVTIVTDNGGPFRSFRFEAFIGLHPELHHVRTRVRTPGQNGSRERGFGTLKYERLFTYEIDDAVMLAKHAEDYRTEYNQIRPHEAIAWNRPQEVHLGLADPKIPTFQTKRILPTP